MKYLSIVTVLLIIASNLYSQKNTNQNKFRQLKQELATPNVYRTASGAPGHQYYQQKANYDMKITLDDEKQIIYGEETVTYINNSPDKLEYLWVQLDQNMRARDSETKLIRTMKLENNDKDDDEKDGISYRDLKDLHNNFDGGFKLDYVKDASGKNLKYTVVHTMMRIDMAKPLAPKGSYTFKIKWWYNINDRMEIGGRSGYEYFKEEDNYLYTIAQFFPRMAVYNDVEGWQNKQFLGRGEFTLPFGDYKVKITVPADHVVASTGTLQNAGKILTSTQQTRLKQARTSEMPVMIVTQAEAEKAEKGKSKSTKTWEFKAINVRDFGFATSRKFLWDAMGVKQKTKTVMAMSYYPKEGNPLWEKYSTKAVAQTLETYSHHTFDYPYPVAISVHTKWIGMEYPMICFNGGRPEPDGTYSKRTKYGMISVIIHEVGHNYFPMIINSDERQWTWMDEGLNTFLQYLTEQQWEREYPSRRGPAYKIVDYMKGDKDNISPIMVNSESIHQFGNNAYGKPATALNILRETILGRDLFDYSFKTYAQRWMFKHPTPADLFRTMEDASGIDLDRFWRGWFYTTDHVDISIDKVSWYRVDSENPEIEKPAQEAMHNAKPEFLGDTKNKTDIKKTREEKDGTITDFYNQYNRFEITSVDVEEYQSMMSELDVTQKEMHKYKYNYYQIDLSNIGGLVMPVILQFEYTDGSKEIKRIPAEIWRMGDENISKVFYSEKELKQVVLDPFLETADVDTNNNYWPTRTQPSRFKLFKKKPRRNYQPKGENLMQRDKRKKE